MMEEKMNLRKILIINLIFFSLSLLIINQCFSQTQKMETITFTGIIKSISHGSILVNEINILISSDTKVFNERGYSLKLNDLRVGLYVSVDTIKGSEGFLAKKIVVKELKGV